MRTHLLLPLLFLASACTIGTGHSKNDDQSKTNSPEEVLKESAIISIDTPVALDDLIVNAESRLVRLSGSAKVEDGQSVSISFSDGEAEVSLNAQVKEGKWFSESSDLSSLSDGLLKITASVVSSGGKTETTKLNHVRLDKTVMPPTPSQAGTIWLIDKVITAADPSSLESLKPAGTGNRTMFDRRTNGWERNNAMLFNATYANGQVIEVQVNPEFTEAEALVQAQKYATEIGRLPRVLRRDAKTVWIHKGRNPFGGGNNNYLIHIGMSDQVYIPRSNLEETLVHEGSHTSLDAHFKDDPEWKYAQRADGTFISEYARDNPNREDIAETFLLYIAYRYRSESLTPELKKFIKDAMSYRMAYFDKQALDMWPFD